MGQASTTSIAPPGAARDGRMAMFHRLDADKFAAPYIPRLMNSEERNFVGELRSYVLGARDLTDAEVEKRIADTTENVFGVRFTWHNAIGTNARLLEECNRQIADFDDDKTEKVRVELPGGQLVSFRNDFVPEAERVNVQSGAVLVPPFEAFDSSIQFLYEEVYRQLLVWIGGRVGDRVLLASIYLALRGFNTTHWITVMQYKLALSDPGDTEQIKNAYYYQILAAAERLQREATPEEIRRFANKIMPDLDTAGIVDDTLHRTESRTLQLHRGNFMVMLEQWEQRDLEKQAARRDEFRRTGASESKRMVDEERRVRGAAMSSRASDAAGLDGGGGGNEMDLGDGLRVSMTPEQRRIITDGYRAQRRGIAQAINPMDEVAAFDRYMEARFGEMVTRGDVALFQGSRRWRPTATRRERLRGERGNSPERPGKAVPDRQRGGFSD